MYEFLGPNIHLTGLLPVLLCVCGLKESVSDLWRYKCHPTKHLFIIWIEKSMERETLKAVTPICGHLNRETTFDTTWCLYCEQFKIQFFSFKSKSRILKLKSRYFAYERNAVCWPIRPTKCPLSQWLLAVVQGTVHVLVLWNFNTLETTYL